MGCSWLEWLHRARSRALVPRRIRNWALVENRRLRGLGRRGAEQFLAPTAGVLCRRLITADVGELDALCVNMNKGRGDVHCEVKARWQSASALGR